MEKWLELGKHISLIVGYFTGGILTIMTVIEKGFDLYKKLKK